METINLERLDAAIFRDMIHCAVQMDKDKGNQRRQVQKKKTQMEIKYGLQHSGHPVHLQDALLSCEQGSAAH